jgi:predicted transcriptional regulator
MFITKEQAERRLNSPDNILNKVERANSHFVIKKLHAGGRKEGVTTLTKEDRLIAGTLGQVYNQKEVARDFGITRQHVNNLAHGRTDSKRADGHETGLEASGILDEVKERALQKVLSAVDFMSDNKLGLCDAKELSSIASNMSKVYSNVSPKENGNEMKVQFVLYAPRVKEEHEFQVVEI